MGGDIQEIIRRLEAMRDEAEAVVDIMQKKVQAEGEWRGMVIAHNALAGAQETARVLNRTLAAIERGPE